MPPSPPPSSSAAAPVPTPPSPLPSVPVPAPPPDAAGVPATAAGRRPDVAAAAAGLLLFAASAAAGALLLHHGAKLQVRWPPLMAAWGPHAGPGTPAAVAVAVLAVAHGPRLAARAGWRVLLGASWAAATAWTWSLALVDGWQRGVAGRMTVAGEFLRGLGRFRQDFGGTFRGFNGHILIDSPQNWGTHIAGHPIGAVLTFFGLDRIGLAGGAWAGAFCITAGSSVAMAALIVLRRLAGEGRARAAAPFLVLTPGAVWVGVSPDAWFAALAAWSLVLVTVAATTGRRTVRALAGLGGGLLLGAAVYDSYGLVLLVVPIAGVLVCARTLRPLPSVLAGLGAVVLTFTLAGFDWWQAYRLLVIRYHQGFGGERPYSYWIWGNLGATVAAVGLAPLAGLRRAAAEGAARAGGWWRGRGAGGERRIPGPGDRYAVAAVLLPCAFVLAILAADLSGMSKAETERIWLPFTLWLPAAAGRLPARDHRGWLAAQALAALLLNHLLLTEW
ncbi:hypothetical protein SAMN05216267_104257 [Actinacidiphila rubida]|uniref:Integral membrane protein n=2 Tax=Actinacidiphila rubida TaxID=310780 RepID=A0A1H8SIR4_9ACTN|nr:hypothetical protein SAMN05216267_104257 [Actinacidiphila rubida]